jgi:hypothetical protein
MNYDSVMLDAFADELTKLAAARAEDEEIEKLAELEVIARQLCSEYDIGREDAYELMKEAGLLGAGLKALGRGVKAIRGLSSAGRMGMAAKAPAMAGAGRGAMQSPLQLRQAALSRQAAMRRGAATRAIRGPVSGGRAGQIAARARAGGGVGRGGFM